MKKTILEVFANAGGKFMKLFTVYVAIIFENPCYGMAYYSHCKISCKLKETCSIKVYFFPSLLIFFFVSVTYSWVFIVSVSVLRCIFRTMSTCMVHLFCKNSCAKNFIREIWQSNFSVYLHFFFLYKSDCCKDESSICKLWRMRSRLDIVFLECLYLYACFDLS